MSTESVYTTCSPFKSMSWSTCPWAQLHLDLAGPFLGRMFLILIDAHCRWIEAYETASAMSAGRTGFYFNLYIIGGHGLHKDTSIIRSCIIREHMLWVCMYYMNDYIQFLYVVE